MTTDSQQTDRRVVVIEDEDAIRDVLEWNLARAGFTVATARDGVSGLELVRERRPALVVLDLMLPGLDGIAVCRELRGDPRTRDLAVIMLTAKGEEADVVLGLEAGADDYVTKPFSPRELVARANAVLRRNSPAGAAVAPSGDPSDEPVDPDLARVELDGVVVDPDRHEVLVDGTEVRFTRTELRLLHALVRRPGRVRSREQLVTAVMGDNAWVTERTIDVHVRAIRTKLGDRADLVETVRGVGYRARGGRA